MLACQFAGSCSWLAYQQKARCLLMYWLASSVLSLQVPTASPRSTLSNVELSEALLARLRGTCWLPRHCRCPIMVSAHLLVRLFAPLHGYGWRRCDHLSTIQFSACSGAQDAIWRRTWLVSTLPRRS